MPLELDNIPAYIRDKFAWVPSGQFAISTIVKDSPGYFAGIVVIAQDGDADGDVIVWDSEDTTIAGKTEVARIRVTGPEEGSTESFGCIPQGIWCEEGIYVQVVAGDVDVLVYYK